VPAIVREALGRDLDWLVEDSVSFTAEDGQLLSQVCSEHGVPTELVVGLLEIERSAHGLKRRHAVHTRIEDLFRQEWRDLDMLIAARRAIRGKATEAHTPMDDLWDDPDTGEAAESGEAL
jgi:DNA sulfur modification protein DndC